MSDVTYRPAGLDDAELAADLMTASYPSMAQDPMITRMRWEHPRRGFAYGRFIAESNGTPIGFLSWTHGPWEQVEDRHCETEVWLDRAALDQELLIEMFTWIGDKAEAEEARLLLAYCGEDEPEMLGALAAVDYRPERIERSWELDLKRHGKRPAAAAPDAGLGDRAGSAPGVHRQRLGECPDASHQREAGLPGSPWICRAPQTGNKEARCLKPRTTTRS